MEQLGLVAHAGRVASGRRQTAFHSLTCQNIRVAYMLGEVAQIA